MQTINQMSINLGPVQINTGIRSSLAPFRYWPDYKILYPANVIQALKNIYVEYNHAFTDLVQANQEWDTDYQYALRAGIPNNLAVQIDMVGLTQDSLQKCHSMSVEQLQQTLTKDIFEVENSIAMYQLLESLFSSRDTSAFKLGWRTTLSAIKVRFKKPIALLAITQEKYQAMLTSEFGKNITEGITGEEVHQLSGFDNFWGPTDLRQHLESNDGDCKYLLFVRSSDPISKLRKPGINVAHELLDEPQLRRVIKANALTFNIDAPEMPYARRINDTKAYMPRLGMGFLTETSDILHTKEFADYLQKSIGGIDRTVALRAKPLKASYGGYGHLRGNRESSEFMSELRRNIRMRGANGSSDARHYTDINGAGIEFGPIGEGIGSDQEYVDISSLDVYYSILKSFLSNPHENK